MPPATTMFTSPARIICEAIATALRPEPQTMLIVVAGTSWGFPAPIATWRAEVIRKARGQDTAEHDLVHLLASDLGLLERGTHSARPELGGRDVLELPAEATDHGPGALTITASSIVASSDEGRLMRAPRPSIRSIPLPPQAFRRGRHARPHAVVSRPARADASAASGGRRRRRSRCR